MKFENNAWSIQGVSLLDIAREFGTPVYVYDADHIIAQYQRLQTAFKGAKLKVKYAMKALSNIHVLQLLKTQGSGLDCVSIQEVKIGIKAGFAPEEILFTPNCVSLEEIKEAVELGVMINIDNISILEQFGNIYGNSVPVCIRINPHIMAGGNAHISVGHIDSKFGISFYQMRHVNRVVKTHNLKVVGLHMHTGSDILDAGVFLQGAELLFEASKDFPDLEFMDFGSGFKVPYKESDVYTDVEEIGQRIVKRFKEFCKEYGRELELWFEPGKFLVSQSGYFLVKTNVIKQTTSTVFVGVDSGQNHLIRPMMYDAYHHITNISNPNGTKRIYSVVGYICETDTFGWDRQLNEVREGDVLAFHNAGAYGFSMSSTYNSRVRPAEVLVYKG
ncbi:MAG: diaminopimelate decarboxylase, partial [Bacteroidota bacterium]|nr:diaminopimelate decarboxylase [Bacteroidota bacterium]MDX5429707.1 diaminopimelate decarboxylase [Bacteroidota bacterium]MDX5468488.1 diaminopimelate decarboxylase [Bacteroidota bacterium]